MTFHRFPWLASAAATERDVRERGFPKLIEGGRVTQQDAEAEIAAWRAIADIFDRGETPREISWSELHLYTSRCLCALEEDVKRSEFGDPNKLQRLLTRRALVDEIHQTIARQKYLVDDTTAILRERAAQERKAQAA